MTFRSTKAFVPIALLAAAIAATAVSPQQVSKPVKVVQLTGLPGIKESAKGILSVANGNLPFVHIAHVMNNRRGEGIELWDNQDGFYYDVLHLPDGGRHYLKVRSLPYWRDCIYFREYFHGDNGAANGASHQTGWTGLVATLIEQSGKGM